MREQLPAPMRARLGRIRREYLLRNGLNRLRRPPWRQLVEGWTNEDYSSGGEYLEAIVAYGRSATGPVLECGSGLSTLALAASGVEVWTLEHDPTWFSAVIGRLAVFGLNAKVQFAPLRDYGPFDWYTVDTDQMPEFSLVVCDGPPGLTRGGRRGLLPVLGGRLRGGCVVLLDDADRAGERDVLESWQERIAACDIRGREKPYAVVTLSAT